MPNKSLESRLKSIVFALSLASGMAVADPLYITIPGEGWTLKLDTPPMTNTRASSQGRLYQYMASSLATGITLSVHTETVGAGSNDECRETYWSKSKDSPTIKGDISLTGNETALFATHHTEAVLQGKTHKTAVGELRAMRCAVPPNNALERTRGRYAS